MSLKEAVISAFKNYANFKGRARRSEYWYFSLFSLIVVVAALIIGAIIDNIAQDLTGIGIAIIGIYGAATIIPNLSVTCRRLHDVGKSGAYVFFFLLPIVGEILVWVWSFQDGQPWTNQYGADPKGRNMSPFGMGYGGYTPGPVAPATEEKPRSTPSKKRCSSCGSEIEIDSVFCPICGSDTRVKKPKIEKNEDYNAGTAKATTTCANCGRTINVDTAFCPFCGENPNKVKHESGSTSGEIRPKAKGFSAPTDLD